LGNVLFGYFALMEQEIVHFAGANLPVFAEEGFNFGLGHSRREPPENKLQSWLSSFGAAGRGGRGILLEDSDGQHAVDTALRRHVARSG
jgi:hypothetical protein